MAPPAPRMKLRYRAVAKLDIQEAREWYGAHSLALEERFAGALAGSLTAIIEHPLAYQEVEPGIRRALVRTFPYLVYYTPEADRVVVLAVLHGKRHPDS